MSSFQKINNLAGWLVFAVASVVYFFSAESTGSLWDCGEFIAGAYKLQVVHPPGAPLFLLIGRLFTWVASLLSSDPASIAVAVNFLSGLSSAAAAMFICWMTTMLTRLALVGRCSDEELTSGQTFAVAGSGVVAGLASALTTSVWFSAVEGEVYAMSAFFTALVMWSMTKWYYLPENKYVDRWLVFTAFMIGLSIGVHLLSLLVIPAFGMYYYLKRYKNHSNVGMLGGFVAGGAIMAVAVQWFVLKLIPKVATYFDYFFVNSLGMPFNTGMMFFVVCLGLLAAWAIRYTYRKRMQHWHTAAVCVTMVILGFSTYGMIIIRANANTPINMNDPSDAYSLVSYLNREQYGDRPLLYGPNFDAEPIGTSVEEKYARDGDVYNPVERKIAYEFAAGDKVLFPRMGHSDRVTDYRLWMNEDEDSKRKPTVVDNFSFFVRYQIFWMYSRYFMWNFAGRQNGEQGYFSGDPRSGNWISGINAVDNARLFNQSKLPDSMKNDQARNRYFMLPLLFGLLGLMFHFNRRSKEAWVVVAMFLMLGLAIIVYSNQPPSEPRERDYVLAGSMFTFCIWIGMGVAAMYDILKSKMAGVAAPLAFTVAMSAPLVMGFQNWDDHSRRGHTASRDYASNFLQSVKPNGIVFTHGDNDTYPLWYAQEVEGIRTDVRVVNLSLIAVDWYIDQLRRKVNNSPAIKMTMPEAAYRGARRNYLPMAGGEQPMLLKDIVKFYGEDHPVNANQRFESYLPTRNAVIPVDTAAVVANGTVAREDASKVLSQISFKLPSKNYIKDDLAVLDIIASNLWERPIYFAVTCRQDKLQGLDQYMQLEGLASRIVPIANAGDTKYGGMLIGKGGVNTDVMYDNIMTKFKWGNFDKQRTYVDKSYSPSVSSTRYSMLRLAEALLAKGDTTRMVNVLDKYFEAYPNFNFTFDYNTLYMFRLYDKAGQLAHAKQHVETLALETADNLEFYASLDVDDLNTVFKGDHSRAIATMNEVRDMASKMGDEAFKSKINKLFEAYKKPN